MAALSSASKRKSLRRSRWDASPANLACTAQLTGRFVAETFERNEFSRSQISLSGSIRNIWGGWPRDFDRAGSATAAQRGKEYANGNGQEGNDSPAEV